MDDVIGVVRDWPLPDLEELRDAVVDLIESRRRAEDAPRQMDWMIQDYQSVMGRRDGDPWVAPVDPLCSYPRDTTATHNGTLYASLVHMNMTEPGTDPEAWAAVQDGENA